MTSVQRNSLYSPNIKCRFTASNWLHNWKEEKSIVKLEFPCFYFRKYEALIRESPGALIPEFGETRSRKWLKTSIARRAIILRMLLSSEIMPPVAGVGTNSHHESFDIQFWFIDSRRAEMSIRTVECATLLSWLSF